MGKNDIIHLFEAHEVKPTANRIIIAEALADARRPLSLTELENMLETVDKSVIYRSLTLFKEHRLVHIIEDGSDGVRYELCHSHDYHHDEDQHAHFYCENCHKTFCLEDTPVPEVTLPEGFKKQTVNYVIKGVCPDCRK